jgi:hypothetical protein
MPHLRWKDGGPGSEAAELMGGICVKSGKRLWLWADGYSRPPDEFLIFHRLGFVMREYCRRKGRLPFVQLGQAQEVASQDDGRVSAGPVRLTPGRRVKWRVFFADNAGNASEVLHVSRLGTFGLPEVTILGNGLRLPWVFTAAVDPEVEVSVVTPWHGEEWTSYLRDLVSDVVGEDEGEDEALAFLAEGPLEGYLPQEPPDGWEFALEGERFELGEGERAEFSLTVRMPTVGAAAFALQASGEVEGEKVQIVSDPLIARMPDDGSETAELLGGDEGDGGSEDLLPSVEREMLVGSVTELVEEADGPAPATAT